MQINKFLIVQIVMLVRIPIGILFAIIFLSVEPSLIIYLLCFLLLILGELSDLFDGKLARKFDVVTELGATFDPYSDSIFRLTVYWSLACGGFITPLAPLVMAFRDITVSYCRIVLTRNNQTVSAKLSGKVKAVVQAVVAMLAVLGPLYWDFIGKWTIQVLSWIVIFVTLASIIEYVSSAIPAIIKFKKTDINKLSKI
jgi:CDP-diacylglycerol---glycerol-3-phosphate 3-phosphatidyltransferase